MNEVEAKWKEAITLQALMKRNHHFLFSPSHSARFHSKTECHEHFGLKQNNAKIIEKHFFGRSLHKSFLGGE